MKNDNETQIIWRLPKPDKGRYVAAARKAGLPLVAWLKQTCDAASEPIGDDLGEGSGRNVARERPSVDE